MGLGRELSRNMDAKPKMSLREAEYEVDYRQQERLGMMVGDGEPTSEQRVEAFLEARRYIDDNFDVQMTEEETVSWELRHPNQIRKS